MRIISTGYNKTEEYSRPEDWLNRISFYTGIYEAMAKRHEVISIERINYEGHYKEKGVQYYFMHLRRSVILFPRRMHRFIKKQNPDAVLVHSFNFPLQVIQLRWAVGKKTRIIIQNHAERPTGKARSFLQRIADRSINAYFFTSAEMGKEWVVRGIIGQEKKIVEVMEVSSSMGMPGKNRDVKIKNPEAPVFLWVGRLNANKDPMTVVKAFIEFLTVQHSAKLYMIYQSEELLLQIRALINSNEIAKQHIQLAGQIPHEELETWYNKADFFISGSHYESGGAAVCEAMSCGCIPVLTDILSFRKITGNGKCGLLYEAGKDKALLKCLIETRRMDIEKEQEKTLQQFKEELSFEAIAGKISKAINLL